jgi:uncharacterized protein YacL
MGGGGGHVKSLGQGMLWLRVGLVLILGILAGSLHPFGLSTLAAASGGLLAGFGAALLEAAIARASLQAVVVGCAGMLTGAMLGFLSVFALDFTTSVTGRTALFFRVTAPIVAGYFGLLLGVAKSGGIKLGWLQGGATAAGDSEWDKILDTSVLIDGRIADIAEAGFLEGRLIVPQFVLHELQLVADSADSAKRNRGRRGLDVVQRLQKTPGVRLEITGEDFPSVRDVDLKLIEFAKLRKVKIVTNDFNLNKLAQVQGVNVLNINELANALKPIVLPGESMRVFILKEGKEYNQGVAYLDDGTMVVVDNAKRLISKTIDISVTSVLQTTAGKMIFGKFDERPQHSGESRASSGHVSASASAGTN